MSDLPEKPKFRMLGHDGNAFALMAGWSTAAKRAGWTPEQIDAVVNDCMSGDYNHLLATLMKNSRGYADET